jgi:hypothetical protein
MKGVGSCGYEAHIDCCCMKEEKGEQLYLMVCTQLQTQLYLMGFTPQLLLWSNLRHLPALLIFLGQKIKLPVACSPACRTWPMPSRVWQG